MIDFQSLSNTPRLLLEVDLKPRQSVRFQPTGFPDLGAAEFQGTDDTSMLLVESAQSMANRLEVVCWDEAKNTVVSALEGLPYVVSDIYAGTTQVGSTSSILEAHRINSPYLLKGKIGEESFETLFTRAAEHNEGHPIRREKFLQAVLRFDPNTLLHGAFLSNVGGGQLRFARCLSAFIEAKQVRPAQSGGVKNDRVNAAGKTDEGYGNVPFARTEYTADSITGYFSLDLQQLRGFGFDEEVNKLLIALALFKVRKLVDNGMRLRTACDFETVSTRVTMPSNFALPGLTAIEQTLRDQIAACAKKKHFASPVVTRLRFEHNAASAKQSKKATQKEKSEGPK